MCNRCDNGQYAESCRLEALNVLFSVLGVAMNFDGANIVVRPERAQSSTNGAVAVGDLGRTTGDLDLNGTAVTCGFEHDSATIVE